MLDHRTLYREAQARVIALVNAQNATMPVPARPGWTVRDVVAHLAGALDDARAQRPVDPTSEERMAAHAAERQGRSLGEVAAEWHLLTQLGTWILAGDHGPLLTTDLICHEFDIRGALGNREARDFDAVLVAAGFFLTALDRAFRAEGVPALRFVVDDEAVIVGQGEPRGTVTLSWFELLRLLSGRRSRAQAAALPWDGDPELWLDHLFLLGAAEAVVVE